MKYSIQKEIYSFAEKGLFTNELALIKMPVNKPNTDGFRLIDKREFKYKGEFYDVVKKKIVNDTIFYYCLNDKKETSLFDNLDKHIKTHNDLNSPHQRKNQNLVKSMIKDYIPQIKQSNSYTQNTIVNYLIFSERVADLSTEVPTPPPQV